MTDRDSTPARRRTGRVAYWIAVTVVSLVLVVGVLLLMQSCDDSTISGALVARG